MTPRPGSEGYLHWLRTAAGAEQFEALPADDVAALARFATPESLLPGEVLLTQGQTPLRIFIIQSGEAELIYETQFERLIIQILSRGATVGYLEAILDVPSPYLASARTEMEVLAFDRKTVGTLVDLKPELCFRWLRLIAQRLDRAQRRLVELAGKTAHERVVHFLLNECDYRATTRLQMTQADLANSLGLSRQTISRVLGLLERRGLLERQRGQLLIADLAGLRDHVPVLGHDLSGGP